MISTEYLDCGATLLSDPGGPAPVVALYLWVRVGSAHERVDEAGAAHFLEHMLFKGAEGQAVGEVMGRVEGLGGDLNAFTSFEQTVLHATVPAGREAEVLELMAGMLFRPALDADELERERGVVLEEIRGAADDPGQLLAEELRCRALGPHPYGRPVLGGEASVSAMGRDQLVAFHRAWYRPDNCVVAVSGPADLDRVRAVLEGLGEMARETAPQPPERSPPSTEPGAFAIDAGFDERLVEVAFPVPGHAHVDVAALDLLTTGLGSGASALLRIELRQRKDLALSAWAAVESEPDHGLLVVGLSPREGKAPAAVEALGEVLGQVARRGLPAGVFRRARSAILSERVRDRETVDGRAHRMAWYAAFFEDPDAEQAYEDAIRRVTPSELQAAAAQWLNPARAVLGAVAPVAVLDGPGLEAAFRRGFDAGLAVAPARRVGGLHRAILSNGLRVLVSPDPRAELVGVSVVGLGGSLCETARTAGLSGSWAAMLTRGAGARDAEAYAEAVEERAGAVRAWAGRNTVGLQASFIAADARDGLELVSDALRAPRFDPAEVTRLRADLVEAHQSIMDDPAEYGWDLAWAALFPGHPWGHCAIGTTATVARVTPRRLARFHQRVTCGRNLVLALSGAVDPDEMIPLLERLLGGLPEGAPLMPSPPVVPAAFRRRRARSLAREGSSAHLMLAFPSVGHGHPQAAASRVVGALLGGATGGAGRLFDQLRERLGLAYELSAQVEHGLGGGALMCSVAADPERERAALAALWSELARLVDEPVGVDELERVKAGLVDGVALGLQRAAARADHLAAAERYGPGAERWRDALEAPSRVTAEQVQAFCRQVLRPDRSVEVRVGP